MFGHSPSPPPVAPPPPALQQPEVDAAGMRQMAKARGLNGASATVKTGGEGLPPAQTAYKTLLGS